RILLVEEPGVCPWLHVVPGAPLVDDERHALCGIKAVHDRRMAPNQLVHVQTLTERGEPLLFAKVRGRAPGPRGGTGHGVVVQAEAIHVAAGLAHQDLGPVIIVAIWSAGDPEHPVTAQVADVGLIAAVEVGVVFGAHMPAAAPVLVPYAVVRQIPGLIAAILP